MAPHVAAQPGSRALGQNCGQAQPSKSHASGLMSASHVPKVFITYPNGTSIWEPSAQNVSLAGSNLNNKVFPFPYKSVYGHRFNTKCVLCHVESGATFLIYRDRNATNVPQLLIESGGSSMKKINKYKHAYGYSIYYSVIRKLPNEQLGSCVSHCTFYLPLSWVS